jgi:serine/threonine protein phosphatase PrpC
VGKTIYVSNAGDALGVISRQGAVSSLSQRHEPFDCSETAQIRTAKGMVSSSSLVNEECDVSRSFGFHHLTLTVNPQPNICTWEELCHALHEQAPVLLHLRHARHHLLTMLKHRCKHPLHLTMYAVGQLVHQLYLLCTIMHHLLGH